MEFWGHPHPHGEPQHQQGQGLNSEHNSYLLSNSKSVTLINRLCEEEENPAEISIVGSPGDGRHYVVVVVALWGVVGLHDVVETF